MVYTDSEYIGNVIRLARKEASMKQVELAKKIGLSLTQIRNIERARSMPSVSSLFKIIEVLNIDIRNFGIGIDNKNPVRGELYKIINIADDKEVEFYLKCIKTISENINLIKS